MKNIKVVFLASGNGGTLKYLYHAIKIMNLPIDIIAVIGDRPCVAVDFAEKTKIPFYVFEKWNSELESINSLLLSLNANIIITNIHKILKHTTVELFKGKLINLHYSLLPAYGGVLGMKTVELAKKDNAKIIGATCHYVNENLDAGQIISQGGMCVNWQDDYDVICNKIFRIACFTLQNGLMTVLSIDSINTNISTIEGTLYSPKLKFDPAVFTNSFWDKIK